MFGSSAAKRKMTGRSPKLKVWDACIFRQTFSPAPCDSMKESGSRSGGNRTPVRSMIRRGFMKSSRQRPALPCSFPHSTIGAEELNFRVRNGYGCGLSAITAGNIPAQYTHTKTPENLCHLFCGQASRPVSTGKLSMSPCLHTRPINPVVSGGPSVRRFPRRWDISS